MRKAVLALAGTLLVLTGCGRGAGKPSSSEVKPISVAPPEPGECIEPSAETVLNGTYPLARPLFIYVNKKYLLEKPAVYHFVKYYLTNVARLAREVGYFPLPEEEYRNNLEKLTQLVTEEPAPPANADVIVDGSSTVFPITQAVAEEFQEVQRNSGREIRVQVAVSGTGGGFKKFVRGETDINDASRPISESEADLCRQNGVEFVEFRIAIDALVVAVNPQNDWCDCLSIAQLREIWRPGSPVRYWNQINPDWPAEEIRLYGADTDSGTFDYFTEAVVGEARASRTDYTPSADDNVLVRGIASDRYALGYIPFAYYVENRDSLKALKIAPAGSEE